MPKAGLPGPPLETSRVPAAPFLRARSKCFLPVFIFPVCHKNAKSVLAIHSIRWKEEFIDIVNENGEADRLLLLHIEESVDQIIRTQKDMTWLRIGDRTRELRGEDLRNLEFAKSTRQYEDEPNFDATIEDLDTDLLSEYMSKVGASGLSVHQVLSARGFIKKLRAKNICPSFVSSCVCRYPCHHDTPLM